LRKLGIKVYLDTASHVDLGGKPLYYDGLLTLLSLEHTIRTSLGGPEDLALGKAKFRASREKVVAEGGGLVSVYYHPNEFIHKEFWDGVNFKHGANPGREDWKAPALATPDEIRIRFETFQAFIQSIKSDPAVRFVTASQAAAVFADKAQGRIFGKSDLREIAAGVGSRPGFQTRGGYALAPSEILVLLGQFVAGRPPAFKETPHGPSNPGPPSGGAVTTTYSQFIRTAEDVAGYVTYHGRVPSTVWLGSVPVSPEAFLVALANVVVKNMDGAPPPATVDVKPATLDTGKYVSKDDPSLWSWVIFPRGFLAPAMMDLAKRQAWTIKPAVIDQAR
jgi:hypothetical protein